jgi:hypothetical protein
VGRTYRTFRRTRSPPTSRNRSPEAVASADNPVCLAPASHAPWVGAAPASARAAQPAAAQVPAAQPDAASRGSSDTTPAAVWFADFLWGRFDEVLLVDPATLGRAPHPNILWEQDIWNDAVRQLESNPNILWEQDIWNDAVRQLESNPNILWEHGIWNDAVRQLESNPNILWEHGIWNDAVRQLEPR